MLRQNPLSLILFFLNLTNKHTGLGLFSILTYVIHPEGQENVENINYSPKTLM